MTANSNFHFTPQVWTELLNCSSGVGSHRPTKSRLRDVGQRPTVSLLSCRSNVGRRPTFTSRVITFFLPLNKFETEFMYLLLNFSFRCRRPTDSGNAIYRLRSCAGLPFRYRTPSQSGNGGPAARLHRDQRRRPCQMAVRRIQRPECYRGLMSPSCATEATRVPSRV